MKHRIDPTCPKKSHAYGVRGYTVSLIERGRRPAFTLIEVLISTALSATLIIAVAAAFKASADAVSTNNAYSLCTQTARLALDQITADLRRADAVKIDPSGTLLQVLRPPDQRTPNELYRQYAYAPDTRRLTLQIFSADANASAPYELAHDIAACRFGPGETLKGGPDRSLVIRVPITITCAIGGCSVTLNATAAPRRTQPF